MCFLINCFAGEQKKDRSAIIRFTLVEVLATMVLIAIVLPVALRGISLAVGASGEGARRREAAMLAEFKLVELEMAGMTRTFTTAGDFGEDWPDYRWRAEVESWHVPELRQLTVWVQWHSGGRRREIQLTTLVDN